MGNSFSVFFWTLIDKTYFRFSAAMEVVMRSARRQCRTHLHTLKSQLTDSLSVVRQALAIPRLIPPAASLDSPSTPSLSTELLTQLVLATVEKVKGVLQDLLVSLNDLFSGQLIQNKI